MLIEIAAQRGRYAEYLVTKRGRLVHHFFIMVLLVMITVMFVVVALVVFVMVAFVLLVMLLIVMHFGDETVAINLVESNAQIQCGESKIIRAEKPKRGLSRFNRCHEGLRTNNRDLFISVIEHHTANPLAATQIQRDRYLGGFIAKYRWPFLMIMTTVFAPFVTVLALGMLFSQLIVCVLHSKIDGVNKGDRRLDRTTQCENFRLGL